MKALIVAGGKGTRLKDATKTIPKALVPIAGKPVIAYQLELLKGAGFTDIVILINHLGETIKKYCGDGQMWGVSVSYFEEKEPLGTAGGIKSLATTLREDFLVVYGDLLFNVDLRRLLARHETNRRADSRCAGTLLVHPNTHPFDSDLVEIDSAQKITGFLSKPHPVGLLYRNLVNAAVYVLTPRIFDYITDGAPSDFGKDVFPAVVAGGRDSLYAYNSPEYLLDMGTPERLVRANADVKSGLFVRGSFASRRPAIFLDRDGVLNVEKDNLCTVSGFELLPGAAEAVKKINESGYFAVVATNQPVIAKGFCDYQTVLDIHKKMETELGQTGAKLDAIYFCAHHPEKGFPGENAEYKIKCACRKPAIGMITQAAQEMNIDLAGSYLIGDTSVDALTAKNAGLGFVGVKTGYGCQDDKHRDQVDWNKVKVYDNVLKAVEGIVASR